MAQQNKDKINLSEKGKKEQIQNYFSVFYSEQTVCDIEDIKKYIC